MNQTNMTFLVEWIGKSFLTDLTESIIRWLDHIVVIVIVIVIVVVVVIVVVIVVTVVSIVVAVVVVIVVVIVVAIVVAIVVVVVMVVVVVASIKLSHVQALSFCGNFFSTITLLR